MKYMITENTLIIKGVKNFDLAKCCSCGQVFRWTPYYEGKNSGALNHEAANHETGSRKREAANLETENRETVSRLGIPGGRPVLVKQTGERMSIFPCEAGGECFFINYFDLERDYGAIERSLLSDGRLAVCVPFSTGIRVFNQEPFETLITFIISSYNNIKRISGIVERLCALCGEELKFEGEKLYAFPKPEQIAKLSIGALETIGAGYRAPYILDAAKRIAAGYDLEKLRYLGLNEARKELLSFSGVGPKVADCVLLFSLGHTDAFPVDVWMGRAMKELFFNNAVPSKAELTETVRRLGKYSGIVQQYIFYYARNVKLGKL